ncbi:MAG: energy transducer TonB [Methylococcales bacterium]|jgi:protein TonB|nr:energy transducer TonB [Methylococcales bacterium]
MYLPHNHHDDLSQQNFKSMVNSITQPVSKTRRLYTALTGEESPHSMAVLLLVLALLIHVWGGLKLLRPAETVTQAIPLIMEVSMVSEQGKLASMNPTEPAKQLEPIKPKKSIIKKSSKKKVVVHKQLKLPKTQSSEALLPKPSLTESIANTENSESTSSATTSVAKTSNPTEGNSEPFTEASFNANYESNPKPVYPAIAKRRGWQGKVLLRVEVSSKGLSQAVTIHQSSGHEDLDESAMDAVKKWQFIPAKRGNTAEACSVIVPIIFTLNN